MKTPEEIKKGLELCYEGINCSECPYVDDCFGNDETQLDVVMPDALAHIKQLESQIPRWIPVEERPPAEVVILKFEYSDELLMYDGQNIRTGHYCHTTDTWYSAEDEEETVTHWMPLPEPPKGGS